MSIKHMWKKRVLYPKLLNLLHSARFSLRLMTVLLLSVYWAHFAGSACGRDEGKSISDDLGTKGGHLVVERMAHKAWGLHVLGNARDLFEASVELFEIGIRVKDTRDKQKNFVKVLVDQEVGVGEL